MTIMFYGLISLINKEKCHKRDDICFEFWIIVFIYVFKSYA